MSIVLTHNAYGKAHVRLTRVTRHAQRHDIKELCIDIQLEGDFAGSYVNGDNRRIVATDTMKNTVYVLARKHGVASVESFGMTLARHFLDTYAHVSRATVTLTEQPWRRIVSNGLEHPHAFLGGGSEKRIATVTHTRQSCRVESGLDDLPLLKTTDSAFAGFIHDEYTTLRATSDRIFATLLTAKWVYTQPQTDWDSCHEAVRQALVDTFANHKSLAVQHTMHAMAEAALASCDRIEQISMQMPNRHHILANLEPFGLDNNNDVFVATQEPFGLIEGTWRRS
jgi:urate oxidase